MSEATQERVDVPAAVEENPNEEISSEEISSEEISGAGNEQPIGFRAALLGQGATRWVGIALIVLITVASLWLAVNPALVQGFSRWGYFGAFMISLISSATIVLPAPGLLLIVAMGAALDPVALGIVAGLGSAVGELTGYALGRNGRFFVPEAQRERFEQLHRLTDRYGAALLFVLSAFPFPFFDLAGIIAGMLRMNVYLFLVAVGLGKSIKYVALILLGVGPIALLQYLVNNLFQ